MVIQTTACSLSLFSVLDFLRATWRKNAHRITTSILSILWLTFQSTVDVRSCYDWSGLRHWLLFLRSVLDLSLFNLCTINPINNFYRVNIKNISIKIEDFWIRPNFKRFWRSESRTTQYYNGTCNLRCYRRSYSTVFPFTLTSLQNLKNRLIAVGELRLW